MFTVEDFHKYISFFFKKKTEGEIVKPRLKNRILLVPLNARAGPLKRVSSGLINNWRSDFFHVKNQNVYFCSSNPLGAIKRIMRASNKNNYVLLEKYESGK